MKYVAWLILTLRQMPATGTPSLPCFKMNAFRAPKSLGPSSSFAPPSSTTVAVFA